MSDKSKKKALNPFLHGLLSGLGTMTALTLFSAGLYILNRSNNQTTPSDTDTTQPNVSVPNTERVFSCIN